MFFCLLCKDENDDDVFVPIDNVNYFSPNYSDKEIWVHLKNTDSPCEEFFFLDMEYYEKIIKMFLFMRKNMSDAEKSIMMKSVSLDSDDFNLFDFFSYFQGFIRKEFSRLNSLQKD